jgi:DNA modification methylase
VEKTAENGMLDDAIIVDSDGTKPIIVRRVDIPSASDERAIRLGIAANRIAELNLEWEPDILAGLADIDLSSLFTAHEFADLVQPQVTPGEGGDDFDATPEDGETRTNLGELWSIGGVHRLVVGDCTDAPTVSLLMGKEKPLLMVTDPPYGVEYDPGWRNEAAEKGLIAFAANREGNVENDDRVDWTAAWELFKGDVVYCWHADRHASSVQATLEASGFEIRSQIIWAKPRFVISRGHYHWQHEPCWYAVRKGSTASWTGDRSQTTLWEIGMRDDTEQSDHGTQKPLGCMQRPIQNHGKEGDIVYDPFLGSGTTLIAAHRTGRRCYGMEISPRYADVCLRRAEAEGLECVLVDE